MRPITFIVIVLLLSLVVNMPSELHVAGKTLYRPAINFSLGSRRVFRDFAIKLGLDLQGGTHLVYQADTSAIEDANRASAVEATQVNIEKRINLLEKILDTLVSANGAPLKTTGESINSIKL
jgi:preprotein translocase subunit SecD